MRFVCLDFEATGTPSPEDRQAICEAAYTPIDDGIIGETWSSLCRPGRPMPPEASAVHHITDEDLADAPAVDFCMLKLGQSGADYYVAHMIDFERHFSGAAKPAGFARTRLPSAFGQTRRGSACKASAITSSSTSTRAGHGRRIGPGRIVTWARPSWLAFSPTIAFRLRRWFVGRAAGRSCPGSLSAST